MAYDPTLPANNSPIVSAELRDQFNGLKDLIDAQQATITDHESRLADAQLQIGDLLNAFNIYVASHP